MSIERNRQIIEQILVVNRKYDSVGQRLAWERGFLTGLLARLANNDSLVKAELLQYLKKNQ